MYVLLWVHNCWQLIKTQLGSEQSSPRSHKSEKVAIALWCDTFMHAAGCVKKHTIENKYSHNIVVKA